VLQELCWSQTSLGTLNNGKLVLVAVVDVPVTVAAVEKSVAAAVMVKFYCDSGSNPCIHVLLPECLAQFHYYHSQL